jgi:hypothetical protein
MNHVPIPKPVMEPKEKDILPGWGCVNVTRGEGGKRKVNHGSQNYSDQVRAKSLLSTQHRLEHEESNM